MAREVKKEGLREQGAGEDLERVNQLARQEYEGNRQNDLGMSEGAGREAKEDVQRYLAELKSDVLEALRSGSIEKALPMLEHVPCLIGRGVESDGQIADVFFIWAKDNFSAILAQGEGTQSGNLVSDALKSLAGHLSNPERFLQMADRLDDGEFSQMLYRDIEPQLNPLQEQDRSLADFFYDKFIDSKSIGFQGVAAQFLTKLNIEAKIEHMAKDLDNEKLSVHSRKLIAEVLGYQPSSEQAAEALLSHVFPRPYDNPTDCFSANLGKFALRFAGGVFGGGAAAMMVLRFLPKSIYVVPEVMLLGIGAATFFALKDLYVRLNKLRVKNQSEEVQLSAAKGLANLLDHPDSSSKFKKTLGDIIQSNINRINDHEIAGVLRQALDGILTIKKGFERMQAR
jgi:hypothetical protein